MIRLILYCLCALTLAQMSSVPAYAEHRVALLIGNSQYDDEQLATDPGDLAQVAGALEKHGFRCTLLEDLNGKELQSAIDSFVSGTPTHGTAIVYFSGHVLRGNYTGHESDFIAGTDAKPGDARKVGYTGYAIDKLLEAMRREGGSGVNIAIIDGQQDRDSTSLPLPPNAFLAFADGKVLAEKVAGSGELLAKIRAASTAFDSTLAADALPTGKGSIVVGPPDKFVLGAKAGNEWVNARGMVFCWCPPGKYLMGSPESEPHRYSDERQREIEFKEGFWISKYELTLGQNLRNHPRGTIAKDKNEPLTMMHLDDANSMCSRMLTTEEQDKGRLPKDWQYSLPTEEQWEYAARAGTSSRYYFGDDLNALPRHANFGDKSYYDSKDIYSNAAHRTLDDGFVRLAPVGAFEPNPWGLHDVYGNVAEWCINSAVRGGSWVSAVEQCRSAARYSVSSRSNENFIGFRLVIQKTPPEAEKRK